MLLKCIEHAARSTVRPFTRSPLRHLLTIQTALKYGQPVPSHPAIHVRMNIEGCKDIVQKYDVALGVYCPGQCQACLLSATGNKQGENQPTASRMENVPQSQTPLAYFRLVAGLEKLQILLQGALVQNWKRNQ